MPTTSTAPALEGLTPGIWNVDPSHSVISFVARHLMVTKVRGRFDEFTAKIQVAENPLDFTVEADVVLSSVDTKDEKRDEHLRSPDFFDVEKFPTMTFRSTSITPKGDDFELAGDLTVHGITRSVVFDLEFSGVAGDPWGGTRAGLSATAEVNRKDFGLEWNVALETGGMLVSDKVKIELDIELVKA